MKKVLAFVAPFTALFFGTSALAAADPEIVSNSMAMVDAAKENIFGIISANILGIVAIFIGILAIFLVLRIVRRVTGGR
jgi:Ca2+/Na+ antiporter